MAASMAKRKRGPADQPPPNPAPNTDFEGLIRIADGAHGEIDLVQALRDHNGHDMHGNGGHSHDQANFDMGVESGGAEQHFELDSLDYNVSSASGLASGRVDGSDGVNVGTAKMGQQQHARQQSKANGNDNNINNNNDNSNNNNNRDKPAIVEDDDADPGRQQAMQESPSGDGKNGGGAPQTGQLDSDDTSPRADGNSNSMHRRSSKGKVGSEEYQANRRLAHKDVERRRREMINEGITELSKMVPGAERNKGSILQRAVAYISELKERVASHEEKGGLAKMMFEQTVGELNATTDRLAAEVRRLEAENERLRKGGAK